MVDAAQAAAAELARQRALPFEDADFENHADSWEKELKIKFQHHDVEYWFNKTEAQMKKRLPPQHMGGGIQKIIKHLETKLTG